jgi:hypothetical protein
VTAVSPEALDAARTEFLWDLFWTDDLGLWELTWTASGRTGRPAVEHVKWARGVIESVSAAGVVRLSITSWPGMDAERPLTAADSELLANDPDPWYAPDEASLLVLVQAQGDPPVPREPVPWRFHERRS